MFIGTYCDGNRRGTSPPPGNKLKYIYCRNINFHLLFKEFMIVPSPLFMLFLCGCHDQIYAYL